MQAARLPGSPACVVGGRPIKLLEDLTDTVALKADIQRISR